MMGAETTRRAVFSALAMTAAPALAIAAPAPSPDTELIALGERWRLERAEEDRSTTAWEEAERRAREAVPVPDELYVKSAIEDFVAGLPRLTHGTTYYRPHHREQAERFLGYNLKAFNECGVNKRCVERCREVLAALDTYEAALERSMKAHDVSRLCKASDRATATVLATEKAITDFRATTIEGLRVKAMIGRDYARGPDDIADTPFAWSIVQDLVGEAH